MDEETSSKDLPLSANVQDIRVVHFVLDLSCHMAERVFDGSITLWCRPAHNKTDRECQENTVEGLTSLPVTGVGNCNEKDLSVVKPKQCVNDMQAISSANAHELCKCATVVGDNGETKDMFSVKNSELHQLMSGPGCVNGDEDNRGAHVKECCHTHCSDQTVGESVQTHTAACHCAGVAGQSHCRSQCAGLSCQPHYISQCSEVSSQMQHMHEGSSSVSRNCSQSSSPIVTNTVRNSNKLLELEKVCTSSERTTDVEVLKLSSGTYDNVHNQLKADNCDIVHTVVLEKDASYCNIDQTHSLKLNSSSRNDSSIFQCSCTPTQDVASADTKCSQCYEHTAEINASKTYEEGNICDNLHTAKINVCNGYEMGNISDHSHTAEIKTSGTNDMDDISDYLDSNSECAINKAASAQKQIGGSNFSCNISSLLHSPGLNSGIVGQPEPFKMVLDCHKLDIHKVEGVYLQGNDKMQFEEHPDEFVLHVSDKDSSFVPKHHCCEMQFIMKEHCVHIYSENVHSPEQFPHAIQIWYQTQPTGPSLKWTRDQDDHPCVFTLGHFLSNRSLFPSQDFPTCLLTWHASITVSPGLTVLLTGDKDPHIILLDDGRQKFSFFTHFPMPTSTFAIAVGSWEMETLAYGTLDDDVDHLGRPQLHLFLPRQLKERSMCVLGSYLPCCMLEVQKMLGTYPFHRLDILIVPACFDSLGMASPSLLFLSQSVLCADGSMCVRVAHELCHTWFGLVIGPQDWTEEWMTEGFCTYLEDVLHARVTQLGDQSANYLKLRAELNLRVLKAEIENTDENLQSLRPNKGAGVQQPSSDESTYLKNGMNVAKKFMQVHYLKGYFLLHALEKEVGREQFLAFLKAYVQRYLYQLVSSQDFLQMFFSTFPDLTDLSVENINSDWLDCPGMPERLMDTDDNEKVIIDKDNALSAQVDQQLTAVIEACRQPRRKRRRGKQPHQQQQQLPVLGPLLASQVILLLDRLLEEELVPGHVLDLLRSSYNLHLDNAEVYHRWCELVVRHRHKKCYSDLQHFLLNHQAMGVYLYGEASISRCPKILCLVRSCFQQLQQDMPEGVRDTVSSMLYGT